MTIEKPLTEFSDEEIAYELSRRSYMKELAAYQTRKEAAQVVLKGIDILLSMEVRHLEHNGCDDTSHWGGEDCTRCRLLDIKESNFCEYLLGNVVELRYIGDEPTAPKPPANVASRRR